MKKQILTIDDLQEIGKLSTTFVLRDKVEACGVDFDATNYLLYLAYWCVWELNKDFGGCEYEADDVLLATNCLKLVDNKRKFENINFNYEEMTAREGGGSYYDTTIDTDKATALHIIQTEEDNTSQGAINLLVQHLNHGGHR